MDNNLVLIGFGLGSTGVGLKWLSQEKFTPWIIKHAS